jgi:spore coat protein H
MHRFSFLIALVFIASCKKEVVIYDNDPTSNLELPLILKFNGENCVYDMNTQTLKISIQQTSLNDYHPFIEFQEYSNVTFNGEKLSNHSVNNLGTLELHKRYTLVIETKKVSKTFQFEFTDIPVIQMITIDQILNEPKTLASMIVHYPTVGKTSQKNWIGIEQRGASSLSYAKKSYGLTIYASKNTETAIEQSFFSFRSNEDWILDAMYVDKSRLRNKTSFEIWESLGVNPEHPSIAFQFVELYLNTQSLGIYCFNENFTKQTLNLNASSVFYRGKDNSLITNFELVPNGNTTSSKWGDWEQRFPKPSNRIEWTDFKELSKTIVEDSDVSFIEKIGDQLDLDNVIDYYLFINLCNGYDNVGKNWSFIKRNPSDKFMIVPWDLDATWGRNAFGESLPASMVVSNGLFQRLIATNPDNFNQRLHNRWLELRSNQFSQSSLEALFESNFALLEGYQISSFENSKWQQSLNFSSEKAYINLWISQRLVYLDTVF